MIFLAALLAIAFFLVAFFAFVGPSPRTTSENLSSGSEILLPIPRAKSGVIAEEAILRRKSFREWRKEPIDLEDLAIILWAAQGVSECREWCRRTVPSAGATYPLVVYVVVGEEGVRAAGGFLSAGVYRYDSLRHSLALVKRGDVREELWAASLRQDWVLEAPVSIVICAIYERTTGRYGERGVRYVHMEAGHAGQNIYLAAAALNLGTVAVGAFEDDKVAKIISAKRGEAPLYIFPIGVPAERYTPSFEELRELIEELRRG